MYHKLIFRFDYNTTIYFANFGGVAFLWHGASLRSEIQQEGMDMGDFYQEFSGRLKESERINLSQSSRRPLKSAIQIRVFWALSSSA